MLGLKKRREMRINVNIMSMKYESFDQQNQFTLKHSIKQTELLFSSQCVQLNTNRFYVKEYAMQVKQ